MTNEMLELILRIGTYDGSACYSTYEEIERDYRATKSVSLALPVHEHRE